MTSSPSDNRPSTGTVPVCYELRIEIPDEKKPFMVELLTQLGETSFVEGAIDCDNIDFDYDDWQHDYYADLAQNAPIVVYSEDLSYLADLEKRLGENAHRMNLESGSYKSSIQPIADQNWRESWKASFKPIDVAGVFIIIPPWENPANFPQKHKIVIDPGMAFGTGQHETTQLCLKLLLDYLPFNKKVFDVGTGSGILAIAARMEGAERVLGNDIDVESISIAKENAEINGVAGIEFTDTSVSDLAEDNFDLIFANIQSKPLGRIFPDIAARSKTDGVIIVSGILESEKEEFSQFLVRCGVEVERIVQQGHWLGIACRKR